jgi:FKBP-type peptidyl-prolyl cis-trans isomerase FklB
MKKTVFITLFCLSAAAPLLADGTNVLSDDKSRISYAIGMSIGHSLQVQAVDIDDNLFMRGVKDEQTGSPTLLTPAEMSAVLTDFQKNHTAQIALKNKTDGATFLAANKTKSGVVTLPDGLQYIILTNGSGAMPTANDTVTVNYRGTFINGTEFDNSFKRGQPASFPVMGVIHGWTEALLQMRVGSKWQLFIPSDLAYGEPGHTGIPPNSTLIFEVELVSVQAPPPPQTSAPAASAQPLTSDIIKVQGTNVQVIKAEDAAKQH